jgi:hypothetical protein
MSDSSDRLRAAFASRPGAQGTPEGCPDADSIWAAVRGGIPPGRTREIGLHAVSCTECGRAWRLAREMAAEAFPGSGAAAESSARAGPPAPTWWLWWGGAALAAAAGLLWMALPPLVRPPATQEHRMRAGAAEPIRSLLPQEAAVPREDCVLRWEGPAGARYALRVADESLVTLYRAGDLEATEHRVPPEALVGLPEGAILLWQLEAVLPDGRRLTSHTFVTALR